MNRGNAYQGHETWWNALRMSVKMYTDTFKYSVSIHVVVFMISCFIFMPPGTLVFAVQYSRFKLAGFLGHYIWIVAPELDAAFHGMLSGGSSVSYFGPAL